MNFELFEKLTKLFKLSFPKRRTIRDNMNCFFSLVIQKNIKRIFKLIIIGVNKLNIAKYEKSVGLINGKHKEIKNENATRVLIKKRNFSKKLSFFIYSLIV